MRIASVNGQRIVEARTKARMTQMDVAFRLRERGHNTGPLQVGRWERGENEPRSNMIPDLAAVLGVTIESLYERSESGEDEEDEEAALRRLAQSAFERQQDDLAMQLLDRVRTIKAQREKRGVA